MQWSREQELRREIQSLGINPHAVPRALVQEVAGADRNPKQSWRSDAISTRQIAKLEELSHQVDKPFTVDTTITKGEAHDLISSVLSGNFKEVQFSGRPQGPLLTPISAPVAGPEVAPASEVDDMADQAADTAEEVPTSTAVAVEDPRAEVTARLLAMLAETDSEADLHANTDTNTAAQFLDWAEGHFTTKAQVALADLMSDRQSLTDEMFLACRAVLLDRDRWHELGNTAAQAYWQERTGQPLENPTITAVADATITDRASDEREVGEDYLETAQHAAQRVLTAAESTTDTGRESDTADEGALEEGAIASRGRELDAIQEAFDLGITPEVDDWEMRAYTLFDPETPLDLPAPSADPGFAAALRTLKGQKARRELENQWWSGVGRAQDAAVAVDVAQLFEEASTSPKLIAAAAGHTGESVTFSHEYRSALREAVSKLAVDGPPLRQAAAQLINTRPAERTPEGFPELLIAGWEQQHADAMTWTAQVEGEWKSWMRAHLLDDPIVATGAGLPPYVWRWPVDAGIDLAFTVLAEDRPDLVAATEAIPRAHLDAELRYDIIANLHPSDVKPEDRHPVFERGRAGRLKLRAKKSYTIEYIAARWEYSLDREKTHHAGGRDYRFVLGRVLEAADLPIPEWIERAYRPVDQAHRQVLATAMLLARGHELYHVSAHSAGLWTMGSSFNATGTPVQRFARGQILGDLRRMHPVEMSLLDAQGFDMDWVLQHDVDAPVLEAMHAEGISEHSTFDTDLTASAGYVIVGDPDGTHIRIDQNAAETSITLGGQQYAGVTNWREAIDEARSQLPRKRGIANTTAPLQQGREVETERSTAQATELDPEPEEPEVDTDTVHESDAAPLPSELDADDGVPIVPEELHGEPLTSPLWRNGGLVKARKESGGTIWISPATAAEYGYEPEAVREPDSDADPEPPAEDIDTAEATLDDQQPAAAVPAEDFVLGTEVLVPSGAKARVRANIAAARLVTELGRDNRVATTQDQEILAQWSGWGAVPEVFDNRPKFRQQWDTERGDLLEILGEKGFAQARETTLNAHYTDPAVVAELWRAVQRAGMPDNALLLEPGCGSGHFVGTAPAGVNMVGVEIEPISAQIAHHLYPSQQIRNHGFERNFADNDTFSGAIGNVPFSKHGVPDPIHNAAGLSLHNQFIVKSIALTAPGGYVAVVTSAYTSDSRRADARKTITENADLVGAVRLPTGAFDRQAKTAVVTDVLIFRKREPGQSPSPETAQWAAPAKQVALRMKGRGEDSPQVEMYGLNEYFAERPEHVLGTLALGHGANGAQNLIVEPNTAAALAEQIRRQLDPVIDQAVQRGLGFAPPPAASITALTTPGLLTGADLESDTVEAGVMRYDEVTGAFEQFTVGRGWAHVKCAGKDKAQQWKMLIALGETVMDLTESARSTDSTRAERDTLRHRLGDLYDTYTDRWGPLNRFTLTEPAPLTEAKITERLDKSTARWRTKIGKAEAREEGIDAADATPYDGPIPEDVLEDLYDKASAEPAPQKNQSHLTGAIARDPRIGMVLAIETFTSRFDGTDAQAGKSAIFTEDTTPSKPKAETAEHVDEAMAISFDELGYLSPERMGELLDCEVGDVIDQAHGRMFPSLDHPGQWEIAEKFLSGHVRSKLTKARMLAGEDPELFDVAVDYLERALPADVDPATIGVRPGAVWVPMQHYRDFLLHEFGLNPKQLTAEFDKVSGNWHFETEQASRHKNPSGGYTDKYGSHALSGVQMFNLIANNKAIQVLKTPEELERSPKPRFHQELTAAARSNAEALQKRFGEWLWSDGDRYVELSTAYNELCNSFVKPRYSTEFKEFPGLNPKYTPYTYQTAAVQRFLHDETILLDHVMGAGKTLTMTISCMEAKRLGQVRQPWVVVPNHVLAQWGKEARDAYPNAKILVASELDGIADRQRFVAQTAVGDWDMVIVPQSVFGLIAMKREARIEYLENEKVEMRAALDAANAAGSEFSVKQIENAIKATTKRIDKIVEQKASDDGLSFEQSGCDFLFIDEAHDYKNLARPSNSADLSVPEGSQRATDLEMKARFLRKGAQERNARAGLPHAPAKAMAFATGTPITNAMSEIWVMTKMLRPDLLTQAGMGRIDNWAGTFANPVTAVEMNITGTKLRMVTRMAEYSNVRQLVSMLDQFRDVVTPGQIEVPLPEMEGGAPQIIEFDQGQNSIDFVADLDERLGKVKGDEMHLDNSLKISTDGRNVTMHPRLANLPTPAPQNSRVEVAANLIWNTHADNVDVVIPADKHGPEMTGAFQLVFCDRGTPKAAAGRRARNVYTELRDALVTRGMNENEIAFMHDHNSPKAKAALMEACRDGRVRVLLTSTKKGGTGLNVQRALKQLVNLDPAWTAADMEQRIGRIMRQGNTFDKVSVVNVVARRSYDATMYQYVARKSAFVAQLRREDTPQTMEDVGGDLSLSWAQTKAAATGDPVFVQQVEAEQKVTMLDARRNAVNNSNAARQATIRALERSIAAAEERLPVLQEQSTKLQQWSAIEDRDKRMWDFPAGAVPDNAAADLRDALRESLIAAREEVTKDRTLRPIASIGGVPVMLGYTQVLANYIVDIAGEERYIERDKMIDILSLDSATNGFIQSTRNHISAVSNRGPTLESQLGRDRDKLEVALSEPVTEFTHSDELEQAKIDAEELSLEVNARENSPDALRQARLDVERRRAAGQYTGWTLDLNPTEGWAEECGTDREALIASVPARMAVARKDWAANTEARAEARANEPWQPLDPTETEWRYGYDPNSGMPGGRTYWQGRQWSWESWDGQGEADRGSCRQRREAFSYAAISVNDLASKRNVPTERLREASRERGAQFREQQQAHDETSTPTTTMATPEEPDVDQSVIDAVKTANGGHPRPLREILGNEHNVEEQPHEDADVESTHDREYGPDDEGERAV